MLAFGYKVGAINLGCQHWYVIIICAAVLKFWRSSQILKPLYTHLESALLAKRVNKCKTQG